MGVSSRREHLREAFAPWAGLVSGVIGGAFSHQAGSQGVFDECNSSPGLVILVCLVGLAIIAIGALESWPIARRQSEGPARRLIATISLATDALIAFAILLPVIAALVIPKCYA
jgi:hypothetical protein